MDPGNAAMEDGSPSPSVLELRLKKIAARELMENLINSNKVAVFSKTYCPYCTEVKSLFAELNIEYGLLEIDLLATADDVIAALEARTGQRTVPNVFFNGNHIGGCDSVKKAHRDGQLYSLLNQSENESSDTFDYDLVVIGGGSGGLAASKEAAQLGKKVAVVDFVEPSPAGTTWGLGGTCVNVGCIPKKLMHQAALLGTSLKDAQSFGWDLPDNVEHNWERMAENIQNYVKSLNFGYRKSLKEKNVVYINAYGTLDGPTVVNLVDKKKVKRQITSRHVLLAVGGRPSWPTDVPGAMEYGISSDDLFWLPQSPGKTLIVGASYIALECAGFLAGIGLDVTVMVRSILLRGFDRQMAEKIGAHMKEHGVKFIEECVPQSVELLEVGPPKLLKVMGVCSDNTVVEGVYNTVMFAIGRTACTGNLGLKSVPVELDKSGKIITNDLDLVNKHQVYAIGDVVSGKPELTPVAIQAGKLLTKRIFSDSTTKMDYDSVPTTVFTPLEYGCVGLSEEDATAKYTADDLEIYHSHFQPLEFTLPGRDDNCYAKLICVKSENERVVGFHVLGPNAGEITQGFAIGMKLRAKKEDFAGLIGIHPTCAEIFTTLSVTKASGLSVENSGC